MHRILTYENTKMIIRSMLCLAVIPLQCMLGCPLDRYFHIRCPGCGLTHAWLSFFAGDLRHALSYHPLFLFAPICILLYIWIDYFPQRMQSLAKQSMVAFAFLNAFCYLFLL